MVSFMIKQNKRVFLIETNDLQYAVAAGKGGELQHLHFGRKCKIEDFEAVKINEQNSNHSALDFIKTEYTPFGGIMYRECALKCTFADGCRETKLDYSGFKIEGSTLKIIMLDSAYSLEAELIYTAHEKHNIIERTCVLKNNSANDIILEKAASAEINLPGQRPYTIINSNGSWGGEFRKTAQRLESGSLIFENRKGDTGHEHMPALIAAENPKEDCGEVYFAVFGGSGNYKIEATRDFLGTTRAVLGLNDFDFSKTLKPGESFALPPVYCGIANGLRGMSNTINDFAIDCILPKKFAKQDLPVLYNSWEATGFTVNLAQQLTLAKSAAKIGCELFVMDDGWFSSRISDRSGLGDWEVNRIKFPTGLKTLADAVNKLGMDFGIWVEPEMVNPASKLYKSHPEWTYFYDTRKPNLLRHQLVLNLTMPEVREYILGFMQKLLSSCNISYIKWDMNRPFSETGAPNLQNQKELWFRHTNAVFEIVDTLKEEYPDVHFEACASGGGRTDFGALAHFDSVWPSDNTDPLDRLEIQDGYSLIYPRKCMRAWVTDTNKRNRPVPMKYRFAVSMQGSLSVGANLPLLKQSELLECKKQIALYKKIRHTVQFGSLYRIMNFEKDKIYFNGYVNADKSQAVYFACAGANSIFGDKYVNLKFTGLDENAIYKAKSEYRSFTKSGAYLAEHGIDIEYTKPLDSEVFVLEKQ